MDANTSGKTKKEWLTFAFKDWLIFRRADYIITKFILGIAVVASILFGLIGPVIDAVGKAPLPMSYTTTVTGGIELPRGTRRGRGSGLNAG